MNVAETLLAEQVRQAHLPEPEREYPVVAGRRWRFDFCWPDLQWAVEIQGGTWVQGRHVQGAGYEADCEKMLEAGLAGWRVLPVTTAMVEDGRALAYIKRVFGQSRGGAMTVTPEQLDALERWAAQAPFPVVNIAAEHKAQRQRIAELEAEVLRLEQIISDRNADFNQWQLDNQLGIRARAKEEP